MKLAFTLEYDGTSFSGFQRQHNAETIQEHIETVFLHYQDHSFQNK